MSSDITPASYPIPRDPEDLKRLMQSLAALDAILSPEWDYRYYSYDVNWRADEEMGSIRNGCGDTVFVLFKSGACFVKGLAHEDTDDRKPPEDYYSDVPEVFHQARTEAAFSPDEVSYCFWREAESPLWQTCVPASALDPDSFFMLEGLDGTSKTYQTFATDYHETPTSIDLIESIYQHIPISEALAKAINPEINYAKLIEDLADIGYPVAEEPKRKIKKKAF